MIRRRRRKKFYKVRWERFLTFLGALALVIYLLVSTVNYFRRPSRTVSADEGPQNAIASLPPEESTLEKAVSDERTIDISAVQSTEQPMLTMIATLQPTQTPEPEQVRMLPVVRRSGLEKNEGKVALTVDDCFQTQNVRKVLDMADQYKFKITFFPIGEVAKKNPALWKEVHDRGHQIENHSLSHGDMTKLTDEEAYQEIIKQNQVINNCLGSNYEMHFFRPMGGIGREHVPLHKILNDMGYFGVAYWSQVGTDSPEQILKKLQSGDIILFHTTNTDIKKLNVVVPGVVERGYQFITLNEMYNLEPNAMSPLQ